MPGTGLGLGAELVGTEKYASNKFMVKTNRWNNNKESRAEPPPLMKCVGVPKIKSNKNCMQKYERECAKVKMLFARTRERVYFFLFAKKESNFQLP